MIDGAVYELDSEKGSRLVYPAGSPEAEAFHRKYGDPDHPVDLAPLRAEQDVPTITEAPDAPDDEQPEPKNDPVDEPETDPEAEEKP